MAQKTIQITKLKTLKKKLKKKKKKKKNLRSPS